MSYLTEKKPERTASIIVVRTSKSDQDIRELRVLLNEEHVGTLRHGDAKEFEVVEGQHTLAVTNLMQRDEISFEALPGHTLIFSTWDEGRGCLFGLLSFVVGMGPPLVFLRKL